MKRTIWLANAVLAGGLVLSSAVPMNVMAEEVNVVSEEEKNESQQNTDVNTILHTSITPVVTNVQLAKGESKKIGIVLSKGATDTALTWTSDNTNLVSVSQDGTISAIGDSGTTNVKVYSTNNSAICATITVTVVGNQNVSEEEVQVASLDENQDKTIYPTTFSLYTKKKTLDQGVTTSITTNGFNANCTNKDVTWSSSNNDVATVDSNGNVKAVGAGQVTITATSVGKNEDMASPASASVTFTVYGLDNETGFKYSVSGNGVSLENYTGTDTEVKIPSMINGKKVTNIGKWVFAFASNSKQITSVTIPNTVVTIDEYAFNACTNLENVNIPDSVKTIGKRAFYGTNLKSVTIPNGVTSIGNEAFSNCKNLEEVQIPSSVKTIGANAFSSSNIKSISLPDSITSIGTRALNNIDKIVVNKDSATAKTLEKAGIYKDKICYNQAPEITCMDVQIKKGTIFDALKDVSAQDDLDGDLSGQIQVVENNYKDEAGTYTIVYAVQDSNGLKTTKERTVTVVEEAKKETPASKEDQSSKTNGVEKTENKDSKTNESTKQSKAVNTSVKENLSMFSLSTIVASIGYLFLRKNKN